MAWAVRHFALQDVAGSLHATEDGYFVSDILGCLTAPTPRAVQLDHFCDVMAGKAAPIITVADALQGLLTVEAVRQSIATGQTVALRDLT